MLKKIMATAMMAGAVTMLAVPAYAGGGAHHGGGTNGEGSILGGNQIYIPISIPIDICGNAVAILGNAGAACEGGAEVGH